MSDCLLKQCFYKVLYACLHKVGHASVIATHLELKQINLQ